jgi:hypothetical protein
VFGREVQVITGPGPMATPATPARRVLEFDDTMEVLGAGVDVGVKIGRHALPDPAGPHVRPQPDVPLEDYLPDEPADSNELGPGVFADRGGWLSGPCLDPVPPWDRHQQLPAGGGA